MASPRLSVPRSYADTMGHPSLAPGIYFDLARIDRKRDEEGLERRVP
jgi:hypothetical protein